MVICLTILSLQQLLDAGKYKYRFSVLRKLGVEEQRIGKLGAKTIRRLVWTSNHCSNHRLHSCNCLLYSNYNSKKFWHYWIWSFDGTDCMTVGVLVLLLVCYFISTLVLFRHSIDP